jgi:hypothetical protein
MRATVHRRSSLPDPFHLGTSRKGREAGSPSAGDARPASVRAGRMSGQALGGASTSPIAARIPTARAPSTGPRHGARRPRLPPRPERSEPRAARARRAQRAIEPHARKPRPERSEPQVAPSIPSHRTHRRAALDRRLENCLRGLRSRSYIIVTLVADACHVVMLFNVNARNA